MGKKEADPDAIYRYLGLGIHPGKIEEFWDSDEEKKKYAGRVKAQGGKLSILERDNSLRNANLMTSFDKIFSMVGGAILSNRVFPSCLFD